MVAGRGIRNRSKLLEEFSKIFDKLASESRQGVPIIVEGKRDADALRSLGVIGEIVLIKSIRGLRARFEGENVRRVILLPDLDSEGERILRLVKRSLEGAVKEIDVTYWMRLKAFRKLGFTQIESMPRLKKKITPPRSRA